MPMSNNIAMVQSYAQSASGYQGPQSFSSSINSASNDKSSLRGGSKGHKPPVSAGSMTPAGAKGSKDNNSNKIINTSLSEQNRVKQM